MVLVAERVKQHLLAGSPVSYEVVNFCHYEWNPRHFLNKHMDKPASWFEKEQ